MDEPLKIPSKINYFKLPYQYKKYLESSGIAEELTGLTMRQIIKRKNQAKKSLTNYHTLFDTGKKRTAFGRYMRTTIKACDEIQRRRRAAAIAHYYCLPMEERVPKNWNKYVAEFANGNHYLRKEVNTNLKDTSVMEDYNKSKENGNIIDNVIK